jgi:hypothetical protein
MRTPQQLLNEKLPLLAQYLECNVDGWEVRIYGVSAQGADYEKAPDEEGKDLIESKKAKLQKLRELNPADRITVVHGQSKSHDLSEPFAWFLK